MKNIYTNEDEFWVDFNRLSNGSGSIETDNRGQIVLYTGYFRWSDGTIRNSQEPDISVLEEIKRLFFGLYSDQFEEIAGDREEGTVLFHNRMTDVSIRASLDDSGKLKTEFM